MNLGFERPVIVLYRERMDKPERRAFAVIKAKSLQVTLGAEDSKTRGHIEDFFVLMGELQPVQIASTSDRFVLCWFDDREKDMDRSWRRLLGVSFPDGVTSSYDSRGKATHNASFQAQRALPISWIPDRPVVDQSLCTGDQVCVTIAPYVFKMNENGKAYVSDPEGADRETIQHAIDQCPSRAIRWMKTSG